MIEFKIVMISLLFLISWIDIRKKEIPDSLSLGMIILGVIYNTIIKGRLEESLLGIGAYSLPFILIYGYLHRVFKKETLGFGDVKLSMGIGAALTFSSFGQVYWLFSGSFILGGVYCVALFIWKRLVKKEKEEEEIPFAPFISAAMIILMFCDKG